jgi:hypothetical protein
MAWTLNVGSLATGATVTYWLLWGNGSYEGVQFVHAKPVGVRFDGDLPVRFLGSAWMEVLRHGLHLNPGAGGNPEYYSYSVTVRNNGPWVSEVELRGGGV